jgi:hypothetical protein
MNEHNKINNFCVPKSLFFVEILGGYVCRCDGFTVVVSREEGAWQVVVMAGERRVQWWTSGRRWGAAMRRRVREEVVRALGGRP